MFETNTLLVKDTPNGAPQTPPLTIIAGPPVPSMTQLLVQQNRRISVSLMPGGGNVEHSEVTVTHSTTIASPPSISTAAFPFEYRFPPVIRRSVQAECIAMALVSKLQSMNLIAKP